MRAATNERSLLRYRVADYRVIDIEAKRAGVVLIVQPDRHWILCDRGQVESGRLDIQVPGAATVNRCRELGDSRRYRARSHVDRIKTEECSVGLMADRVHDEWVDDVVERE